MRSYFVILAYIITGCAGFISCQYKENIADINQVIPLNQIVPSKLLADGISQADIILKYDPLVIQDKASVNIHTTGGIFEATGKPDITIKPNVMDAGTGKIYESKATLISSTTVGWVYIISQSNGYSKTDSLEFQRAYADSLYLIPENLTIPASPDKQLKITVQLSRIKGTPSLKNKVDLTVLDKDGKKHGIFIERVNESDSTGKCTFTISMFTDTFTGPLILTATHERPGMTPLIKTVTILSK